MSNKDRPIGSGPHQPTVADVHSQPSHSDANLGVHSKKHSSFADITGQDEWPGDMTSIDEGIGSIQLSALSTDSSASITRTSKPGSSVKVQMFPSLTHEQYDSGFNSGFQSGVSTVETKLSGMSSLHEKTSTSVQPVEAVDDEEEFYISVEKEPFIAPFPRQVKHTDESVCKAFSQDEDGDTDLHIAVVHENIQLVQWLITLAVRYKCTDFLDLQNDMSQTALHLACVIGNETIIKLLVKSGANPGLQDKRGDTCFHLLGERNRNNLLQIMYLSCSTEQKSGIDRMNYDGMTALLLAAQDGHHKTVTSLLNIGADPNVQDGRQFRSALYIAVDNKDQRTVAALIKDRRTDVNLPSSSDITPLDLAQIHKYVKIEGALRAAGAVEYSERNTADLQGHPMRSSTDSDISVSDVDDDDDYPCLYDADSD